LTVTSEEAIGDGEQDHSMSTTVKSWNQLCALMCIS